MKKVITLILAAAMILSVFAGCGGGAKKSELDIGIVATDTTNPFIGWLTGEVKKQAEADDDSDAVVKITIEGGDEDWQS